MIKTLLYVIVPLCVAGICFMPWSAQSGEATRGDTLTFRLLAQGTFLTRGSSIGRLVAGDFYGNGHELIIAEANWMQDALPSADGGEVGVAKAELTAFRLPDRERVWQYPARYLQNLPDVDALGIAWTVGDTDDDGKDEILVFEGETLYRHEWNGKNFQSDTFAFPGVGIVDQALVGDIDNIKGNELITLSFSKTDGYEFGDEDMGAAGPADYTLSVWRVKQNKYELAWQDSSEMGYHTYVVIPPDRLVTVGDVENTGKNTLVLSHAQSDVSPTHYDFLIWADASLKLKRSIILSDGKIWHYKDFYPRSRRSSEEEFWMLGPFHPVKWNGKTWLLGSWFPGILGENITHAIIRLENDNYVSLELSPSGTLRGEEILWIDPDGKGKGLLCLSDSLYHFYRLR